MIVTANDIISTLLSMGDEWQRENLMRFFKTGKGEYGEGDRFIGIKVPDTRIVVKEAKLRVPLSEIDILLKSEWHEVRLCGPARGATGAYGECRTTRRDSSILSASCPKGQQLGSCGYVVPENSR